MNGPSVTPTSKIFDGLVFYVEEHGRASDQACSIKDDVKRNGGVIAPSPRTPIVNFILVSFPHTQRPFTIYTKSRNWNGAYHDKNGWNTHRLVEHFGELVDDEGRMVDRANRAVLSWGWVGRCIAEKKFLGRPEGWGGYYVRGKYHEDESTGPQFLTAAITDPCSSHIVPTAPRTPPCLPLRIGSPPRPSKIREEPIIIPPFSLQCPPQAADLPKDPRVPARSFKLASGSSARADLRGTAQSFRLVSGSTVRPPFPAVLFKLAPATPFKLVRSGRPPIPVGEPPTPPESIILRAESEALSIEPETKPNLEICDDDVEGPESKSDNDVEIVNNSAPVRSRDSMFFDWRIGRIPKRSNVASGSGSTVTCVIDLTADSDEESEAEQRQTTGHEESVVENKSRSDIFRQGPAPMTFYIPLGNDLLKFSIESAGGKVLDSLAKVQQIIIPRESTTTTDLNQAESLTTAEESLLKTKKPWQRIISSRWVLACLKEGHQVAEGPFMMSYQKSSNTSIRPPTPNQAISLPSPPPSVSPQRSIPSPLTKDALGPRKRHASAANASPRRDPAKKLRIRRSPNGAPKSPDMLIEARLLEDASLQSDNPPNEHLRCPEAVPFLLKGPRASPTEMESLRYLLALAPKDWDRQGTLTKFFRDLRTKHPERDWRKFHTRHKKDIQTKLEMMGVDLKSVYGKVTSAKPVEPVVVIVDDNGDDEEEAIERDSIWGTDGESVNEDDAVR
ncbi:hypothetical protein CI109_104394 [Kwoniella shandongensis]|uniref:Uncharacterized protein n=1 Tax=Kwoniella shandongensis TaxID=1734106 RepID=A0A5M6BX24_9TREE|nr:uncharacterized protein CI109_004207 [Kwoniella shandongensis]KAA5527394.1 hypothetical protein CI109_004207 [Kwoniella shandongensis]